MALILSIDTALQEASVCLAEDSNVLAIKKNSTQMEHAAWIQGAISEILSGTERNISQLQAVAVSAGPGSYTGLRVGMSTAKGICYALGIPLITVSTLWLMAQRVKREIAVNAWHAFPELICPMIDARRMEVFTSLYDLDLNEKMAPAAIVLDEACFKEELNKHVIIFCGNGSQKWQHLCMHPNALFVDITLNVADLAELAAEKYKNGGFSDLVYAEPAYLKSVYTGKSS